MKIAQLYVGQAAHLNKNKNNIELILQTNNKFQVKDPSKTLKTLLFIKLLKLNSLTFNNSLLLMQLT